MTEREIEAVAEELAKEGGISWHPGRTKGPVLMQVGERYRDRAKLAIAALDRVRAQEAGEQASDAGNLALLDDGKAQSETLKPGDIVVYRPPGEKRAVTCTVEKLEEGRAYLVPCPLPTIGWIDLTTLQASED